VVISIKNQCVHDNIIGWSSPHSAMLQVLSFIIASSLFLFSLKWQLATFIASFFEK
jgi:hypothetical protein